MAKLPLDREIHVWRPMKEGVPYVAMISGLSWVFKGPTAVRAKRAASDFRLIETHKILGVQFPEEHKEALAAAQQRKAEKDA